MPAQAENTFLREDPRSSGGTPADLPSCKEKLITRKELSAERAINNLLNTFLTKRIM